MDAIRVTGSELVTVLALLVSFGGLVVAFWRGSRDARSEDAQAVVERATQRAETNAKLDGIGRQLGDVKSSVDKLDGRMDALAKDQGAMIVRIVKLEESDKAQWARLDEIKDENKIGGTE